MDIETVWGTLGCVAPAAVVLLYYCPVPLRAWTAPFLKVASQAEMVWMGSSME